MSPLLPIAEPRRFFERVAEVADAVVVDHYIGGDGSPAGSRTLATPLPQAMACVDATSVGLDYRERMVAVAEVCRSTASPADSARRADGDLRSPKLARDGCPHYRGNP